MNELNLNYPIERTDERMKNEYQNIRSNCCIDVVFAKIEMVFKWNERLNWNGCWFVVFALIFCSFNLALIIDDAFRMNAQSAQKLYCSMERIGFEHIYSMICELKRRKACECVYAIEREREKEKKLRTKSRSLVCKR